MQVARQSSRRDADRNTGECTRRTVKRKLQYTVSDEAAAYMESGKITEESMFPPNSYPVKFS